MSNRSSIFSFNIFSEKIYPTKAFMLMLLFVSISFLGIFCLIHSEYVKRLLEPRLGDLLLCLENNLQQSNKPLIIFIGTSRFHAGINEDVLNKEDLKYHFLNLSASSLAIWEQKLLIDLIPANTDKVAGVVLECHFSNFSTNGVNPVSKQKSLFSQGYDTYSTFSERLLVKNPEARKILIERWFYQRRPLENYLTIIKRLLLNKRNNLKSIAPPGHRDNEKLALYLKNNSNFEAVNIAKSHLMNYEINENQRKLFEKTLQSAKDKNIPLVLVHAPVRKEYIEYFNTASQKENEQYDTIITYLRIVGKRFPVLLLLTPEDCGLTNEIFLDYAHISKEGSIVFSICLWNIIKGNNMLNLHDKSKPPLNVSDGFQDVTQTPGNKEPEKEKGQNPENK